MELNPLFLERMRSLLGDAYDEYIACTHKPPFKGLRINTLKSSKEAVEKGIGLSLEQSPFCREVYNLPSDVKALGNHPLHHCGAFYLGDPSATSAVAALDPQEGDIVLDMCASPGGKTVGIAAALCGKGFLVSNEVVSSRIAPLLANTERMGICNISVTNCHPEDLATNLPEIFTKVLVDAPCSGEGMMLRDGQANANWSEKNIAACAERQARILDSAAKCVAPGGILVYSTCTFAPEENEQNVERFLENHPDFSLDSIPAQFGIPAFPHLCDSADITKARRIFPMQGGDGHFVARFIRQGVLRERTLPRFGDKDLVFDTFWRENFLGEIPAYKVKGDKVFISDGYIPNLPGEVRTGVFAGYIKGNRFEPSHSLYCAAAFEARQVLDLSLSDPRLTDYMKGLEIDCDTGGYTAVKVEGIPFTFGKASNGRLKNHYPKGLRLLG